MRSPSKRFLLVLLAAGIASGVATGTTGPASSAPASAVAGQADEGLRAEGTVSYVVDPEDVVTRVTATITLTHTRPDDATGSWYFDSYSVPVPIEATDLWATVDGTAVTVATGGLPGAQGIRQRATVELSPRLLYGQTREVVLGYELGQQPERDEVLSQANEVTFMFPAWAIGDPGLAGVEVRVPADYDVSVMYDELDRVDGDDEIMLSASAIETPSMFGPLVLAIDESRAVTRSAETSIGAVELRPWPDHDEWVSFVVDHVDNGAPLLSELIGQPWPDSDQPLTIVETLTVMAEGFGGWYDSATHTISIGDRLDPHLVLHEIAHVWINFDVFTERWLVEGFAEEYAFVADGELGQPEDRPGEDELAERPVQLNQWTPPLVRDEASQETEEYGYSASAYVIGRLKDDIGPEAMQQVLQSAIDQEITYVGGPEPESLDAPVGWRQALDLFENHGASEADGLFRTYVLTSSQEAELDRRAEARVAYEALVDQGGDWAPPFEVRSALAAWDFDTAGSAGADAVAVLALRDEIDDVLEGFDVGPLGLEADYEAAEDVAALVDTAEDTLEAAEAYRDVQQQDREEGILATIGLWGSPGSEDRLGAAREALADGEPAEALRQARAASTAMQNATRDGALRLAVVVVAAAAAALVAYRVNRRRERRREAAARWSTAEADDPDVAVVGSGDAIAARRRLRALLEDAHPRAAASVRTSRETGEPPGPRPGWVTDPDKRGPHRGGS